MSHINNNSNRELIIKAQQEKIINLSAENIRLSNENSKLESHIKYYHTLEEKLNKSQNKIKELNKKHEEYIIEKEKALKDLQLKYDKLCYEKEYESEKYNTNISIYNQKMSMVHQTEMENEIYRNEIKELKEKNDDLKNATKIKLESLEIKNAIKYNELKKKMMNHLYEAKNSVSKLNLNYMDINSKISILQNHQLLAKIEYLQEQLDQIRGVNNKLNKKIIDLQNDIEIHKKIEINLVSKLKDNEKENNSSSNKKKSKKQKFISLNKFNSTTLSYSNNNKNSSLMPPDLKKNIFNKYSSNENLNKFLQNDAIISKSLTSYDNMGINKEKEKNNFSFSGSGIGTMGTVIGNATGNQASMTTGGSGREINYSKYRKILKEKNIEIENLKLKIEKLKDKSNIYFIKYKGLFTFLEECLNEFFNDEEILNIKNMNINYDDIKKFDFGSFTKEEKYGVLILLMNHLMPILTLNFKSNCNLGNTLFTTNLNLIDKNFNSTQKFLNDANLKKAFVGKNKKVLNEFRVDKRNNKISFSIPILRKYNSPDDFRLLDNRFKTLI